jgi:DNA invertase Pin-like site-specific DNA recombinase
MLVGYARVSTAEQSLALQRDALAAAGCERVYTDVASGVDADRDGLAEAFDYVRGGDTLVVWRLDRLGRSLKQLIERVTALEGAASASVRSRGHGHDDERRPAHLPRVRGPGRVRAGGHPRAHARRTRGGAGPRAPGRRPPALTAAQIEMARTLLADRTRPIREVYTALHVSRSTLYRQRFTDVGRASVRVFRDGFRDVAR